MVDDRNDEVHERGSSRSVAQESVEFAVGAHHIDGAVMDVTGPPGMPPAVVYKPTYRFTIGGVERNATEACATYLALLQGMVAKFEADHP